LPFNIAPQAVRARNDGPGRDCHHAGKTRSSVNIPLFPYFVIARVAFSHPVAICFSKTGLPQTIRGVSPLITPKDKNTKRTKATEEEKALSSVGLRPPYNPEL